MPKNNIYIPGFKKQYSINGNGEVWSHYRYLNNGRKEERNKMLAICKGTNESPIVSLWIRDESRVKPFYLRTLMKEFFNLTPPDNYHLYDLVPNDGVWNNCSTKNLVWRIRSCDGNWKYYPQPFYDKAGRITHKRCCECGKKKEMSHFDIQVPRKKNGKTGNGWRYTYRNNCGSCRASKQWNSIKSCPKRYTQALKTRAKWNKSKKGRAFHRKYDNAKRANLVDWYVKDTLSMRSSLGHHDITPQMIDIQRKYLTIHRKLKTKIKSK